MNLDDKLKDIKGTVTSHLYNRKSDAELWQSEISIQLVDKVIEDIKQAFADAGYIYHAQSDDFKATTLRMGLMTGQEWYDRFYKETSKVFKRELGFAWLDVDRAAKRASGIE